MVSHSPRCSKPKIRVPACWGSDGSWTADFLLHPHRAERASQLSSLFHRGMDPTRGLHLHELPASKYLTALGCFPLWISEPYLHPLVEANPSSGSCSPFVPLEKEQELLPVSPGGFLQTIVLCRTEAGTLLLWGHPPDSFPGVTTASGRVTSLAFQSECGLSSGNPPPCLGWAQDSPQRVPKRPSSQRSQDPGCSLVHRRASPPLPSRPEQAYTPSLIPKQGK